MASKMPLLWLLLVAVHASPVAAETDVPDHGWINNTTLRHKAEARQLVTAPRFEVNLDDPPQLRWAKVYADPLFANAARDIHDYLAQYIPEWALPLLVKIGASLRGKFPEYGEEMQGVAKALNMDIGDVVIVNIVYQLEGIAAGSCTVRNTTGPCKKKEQGPGLCTSFVAEGSEGFIWHGRNMDWNLDQKLLKYVIDVDFTRGGKTIYTGSLISGMVGLLHGVRYNGFSLSLNARDHGGNALLNILNMVLKSHALTPTHLLRKTLEENSGFDDAVRMAQTTPLVDPAYLTMAGCSNGQGAVITRDRKGGHHERVWFMNNTADPGHGNAQPAWYKLQTNYDNNQKPPVWDDRRTPGKQHLEQLGQKGLVNTKSVLEILKMWPTFNHHTDVTAIMSPCAMQNGVWSDGVWEELPSKRTNALYV